MTRHASDNPDSARPTLVLLHGATAVKDRVIDKDAMVLGRGRGCDFSLDAPDISTIHCVLTKGSFGFHVRDCGSRAGTKVNGERVQESTLRDGDLLQVGPFCFQLNLPAAAVQPQARAISESKLRHLERSRRNLARLALSVRGQLRRQEACAAALVGESPTSVKKKTNMLEHQLHNFEDRFAELAARECALEADRRRLDAETAVLQNHVREADTELENRRAIVEADIERLWEEFRERCRQEEERLAQAKCAESVSAAEHDRLEQTQDLLRRRQELLAREWHTMQSVHQESTIMHDNLAKEPVDTTQHLPQQSAAIAHAEAQLREQRGSILKMMADLRKMQEAVRNQHGSDAAALREENERLRRELEDTQQRLVQEMQALRQENEELLAALTEQELERTNALMQADNPAPTVTEADPGLENAVKVLREELERLREQLAEKDRAFEVLQKQATESTDMTGDPQSIEAELNRFRRQLEGDRQKLNKEMESLRERNQELDEETRNLEMEMSKDRAEIARERARLERLRDEVRMDAERVERSQRSGSVRDRLSPLQKLRDDINGGKTPAPAS